MWDSNSIILEFISKNWIALMIVINTLQGIAWLTPSVKDDKVVTLIKQTFDGIRNFKQTPQNTEDKKSDLPPYEYTDDIKKE